MPVREWDGASYDRISTTMEALGLEVLERLAPAGGEVVLDAGCGSGRVTEALLQRLPRGRVIAVDESASMVEAARRRLGPEVDIRALDLLELELEEPVDAILSTATFHWIADHERFLDWRPPWNYAAPQQTRERLLATGFAAAECWLTPAPREPEHPREFLATIVLGPHVQQLPADLRERFMDDVLEELGEPVVVDYVRLNIDATA